MAPHSARPRTPDFRLFCALVEQMHPGGVYLNWGSAVLLPEVFLKSRFRRPQSRRPTPPHYHCELRLYQHYRPLQNVVKRPTAPARAAADLNRAGYAITGQPRAALAARRRRACRRLAQENCGPGKTMTLFDDNPLKPPDENLPAQPASDEPAEFASPESAHSSARRRPHRLRGSYACHLLALLSSRRPAYSWSWAHLVVFLVFGFSSLLVVQLAGVLLLSADKHLSQKKKPN